MNGGMNVHAACKKPAHPNDQLRRFTKKTPEKMSIPETAFAVVKGSLRKSIATTAAMMG